MDKRNCDSQGCDCISGVCCSVENCKHHAIGDVCTATHINVKSEDATTKAETFCGTFAPVDTWQTM
ncbi:MAG: DUF1540 domain-containing protein [Oscillospiraceae bacterium]|nr:DUF1540 domain-containing protein [Oscillospiraceae bacterium]